MANKPRIAIVGFVLESNGHAPVVGRDDFIRFSGQEILDDLGRDAPRSPAELSGFVDRLTALRDWEPVPITIQSGGAAGPVDQAFFDGFMAEVNDRLAAAGPVDGVYFPEHGAGTATTDPDPDGTLMARVREIVGPRARLIASLDLHANVNDVMAVAVDMMCSYLTNPHVDQYARGTECAEAMHAMLDGLTTAVGFAKLPLIPPSIAQNTKAGPYADHIAFGQSLLGDGVMNVSLCSGFSLGDTVKNGMSVTVTSRGDKALADRVAARIAGHVWAERERYLVTMTPLAEAVAMMLARNRDPALPSLCFADAADNPGGGGRGNTPYILKGFLEAGCRAAVVAPVFDPALAAEAHERGAGASFRARFNRAESTLYSDPFDWGCRVEALHDGTIVGRRGIRAGRTFDMGPSALLDCDGMGVVVTSKRLQFADPAIVECFGLSMSQVRGLVVKSRGHFRAAVDEVFTDDRIMEVDVPGLTTPILDRVPFRHLPRPIYPLDRDMVWAPAAPPRSDPVR